MEDRFIDDNLDYIDIEESEDNEEKDGGDLKKAINPSMSGLYITEPHASLLYQDKQKAIIKTRLFKRLEEQNILVSKDKAYGVIQFNPPEKIDVDEFRKRYEDHKISNEERENWWGEKDNFFIYTIKEFEKFEQPKLIKSVSGAQVFVEGIEFIKEDTEKEKISKPEETDDKIRIPVSECKITATIPIGEDSGIQALYCGEEKQVATYLFDKEKFTMDDAKKWVKEHTKEKAEKDWSIPIYKSDEERFVLGIPLQPDIEDLQGDVVSCEEIAKTAHDFLESCQNIGVQHTTINKKIKLWESYLAPQDLTISGQEVKKGSWILGVHILDDEIWGKVKSGELTGFSIRGTGTRSD